MKIVFVILNNNEYSSFLVVSYTALNKNLVSL
jgi:hypothetical protein